MLSYAIGRPQKLKPSDAVRSNRTSGIYNSTFCGTMTRRLYKIWKVATGVERNPGISYVQYDAIKKTMCYPLVEIISVMPDRWSREDMVSTDPVRLQEFCNYLNEIADSNEYHEVREDVGAWERAFG